MDSLLSSAASGMRARMEALDVLANNIANTGTAGFKLDRESYNIYVAPEALEADAPAPATLPVTERTWTDFSQGNIVPTGNSLDFALSGPGFFAVNGPNGTIYTRNGSFRLANDGTLTTSDGYAVRDVGGGTLQLDAQLPFDVSAEGTIQQAGNPVGQIEVVNFADPSRLVKFGKSYLEAANGVTSTPATGVEVQQGKVETSNVSAPESAVRLIGLMRQFEMLQKAITMNGQMAREAIEQVAKVS